MLRFYDKPIWKSEDMDIVMAAEHIMLGKDIWSDGKEYFKHNISLDPAVIQLLPVENEKHEIICYAYQDREADREHRMLRELDGNEKGICFQDIFPKIQNVIVCGCNELAYYFVLYLQKQKINVSVLGKYWSIFGYENSTFFELDGKETMVINAEEISLQTGSLYQTVLRSASPH